MKKLLSGVLAFALLFGSAALPENVFETSSTITASAATSVPSSGKCGKNVYYTLKNGVLTISGSGAMYDYDNYDNRSPFDLGQGISNGIKSVIIKNGVTTIGERAFRYCGELEKISLPNSLKSIGFESFYRSSLKTITIPANVSSISTLAFEDCWSLTAINVNSANKYYSSLNGILYNKKKTKLIECPISVTNKKVVVPNGVTTIGDSAFFSCYDLKSVKLPNSIRTIETSAFNRASGKFTVNFPKGLKTIGDNAFYMSGISGYVTLPNTVTYLGNAAFSFTGFLTGITVPDSVTKIGEKLFFESSIKTIKLGKAPITTEHFGGECKIEKIIYTGTKKKLDSMLSYYTKSMTIGNGVTTIADNAFYGSYSLENLKIGDTVTYIGDSAFWQCVRLKSVSIGKSVKTIGKYAFFGCDELTSITLPDGLKTIREGAFLGMKNVKKIVIPESVTSIGKHAIGYYNMPYHMMDDEKLTGLTIYCYRGSEGERYAKANGFKYVLFPSTTRLAGDNRYSTAATLSSKMYKTANTVVLATGLTYQDALVAVPLANAYKAPLLLGTEKHITDQTLAELKRLKAKNVIVVSTNGAIGDNAKAELKGYKVTSIAGKNYYETATKVAKALQTKTKKAPDTIFFATDSAFADALSASPVAAIKNAPIIYLKNKGSIDSATAAYLKSVKGKVKNAYVIGGDGVISDAMMKNVATALGLKSGKTVVRVAGKNRYETCVAVNKKFKNVVSSDGICVAKGLDFPDALAGGVYAAKTKQALFLADGNKLQDVQITYLKGKNASRITVFGGTGAVSDELVKLIAQASV